MTIFLIICGILNALVFLGFAIGTFVIGIPSIDDFLKYQCRIKKKVVRIIIETIFCIIFAPAIIGYTVCMLITAFVVLVFLTTIYISEDITEGDI